MDPQDQTFMTIHNLSPDANILFASESILDILGYQPDEVLNKSSFDFFHPDEVPLARSVHSRGVRLDKAAVLHYARIRSKDGRWVSCECCFTIVHDVLVASTSIYSGGVKSEGRAITAPRVRRLFSCSPRDPRYHMLEHLSPKFRTPPAEREPRAALVLNRFTRNLTVMFATNAVEQILGLRPDELLDRPFYHCIQENCLADAIACLESAKKNESIAYLRFRFRDPRQDDEIQADIHDRDGDRSMVEDDDDDGESDGDSEDSRAHIGRRNTDATAEKAWLAENSMDVDDSPAVRLRAGRELDPGHRAPAALTPPLSEGTSSPHPGVEHDPLELEAVVSCTSDGLVVVLRKARPPIPDPLLPLAPAFNYEKGLFAAPWSLQPIEPYYPPELLYTFRAPFLPQFMPLQEHVKAAGGPPRDQLMRSIQDVAVFAWAVVGINGNLADYSHGLPRRGAQPAEGLPIWDPSAGPTAYRGPENGAMSRNLPIDDTVNVASGMSTHGFGEPPLLGREADQRDGLPRFPSPGDSSYNSHQHPSTILARSGRTLQSDGYGQQHDYDYRRSTSRRYLARRVVPQGARCDCEAQQLYLDATSSQRHNRNCGGILPVQAPTPPEESYYISRNGRQ